VGARKRDVDARIEKTAADMIVPFTHLAEMMDIYRRGFESRGLDYAIWGHLSDGNVHPNVIPRSYDDVVKGKEAILEFGREVARLGGCPLAEHGVGRNPVKQALLSQLYGEAGIAQMRAVKRALDPEWKLAPGVVFDR
jgi:D-lactate dehydrogenase (cytochrome)